MLKELKALFERNSIDFYLACGTALGCIRHEGFIPWDDDVDIYIKAEDYDRVRELFDKQNTGNLAFQDYKNVREYPYPFPKIIAKDTVLTENSLKHLDYRCGVYIDIFPLMSASNDARIRASEEKKRYRNYCRLKAYYFKFSGGKKLLNIFAHIFVNPQKVQEELYKQYTTNVDNAEYVIDIGTFGSQALIKAKDFETSVNKVFEGTEMPMPSGYDSYLTGYYGDYMKLPPKEQRVARHQLHTLIIEGKKMI